MIYSRHEMFIFSLRSVGTNRNDRKRISSKYLDRFYSPELSNAYDYFLFVERFIGV